MKLPKISRIEYDRLNNDKFLVQARKDHKSNCKWLHDQELAIIFDLNPIFEHHCSCGYWDIK